MSLDNPYYLGQFVFLLFSRQFFVLEDVSPKKIEEIRDLLESREPIRKFEAMKRTFGVCRIKTIFLLASAVHL